MLPILVCFDDSMKAFGGLESKWEYPTVCKRSIYVREISQPNCALLQQVKVQPSDHEVKKLISMAYWFVSDKWKWQPDASGQTPEVVGSNSGGDLAEELTKKETQHRFTLQNVKMFRLTSQKQIWRHIISHHYSAGIKLPFKDSLEPHLMTQTHQASKQNLLITVAWPGPVGRCYWID